MNNKINEKKKFFETIFIVLFSVILPLMIFVINMYIMDNYTLFTGLLISLIVVGILLFIYSYALIKSEINDLTVRDKKKKHDRFLKLHEFDYDITYNDITVDVKKKIHKKVLHKKNLQKNSKKSEKKKIVKKVITKKASKKMAVNKKLRKTAIKRVVKKKVVKKKVVKKKVVKKKVVKKKIVKNRAVKRKIISKNHKKTHSSKFKELYR